MLLNLTEMDGLLEEGYSCIYGPCKDCVFTQCNYTTEDEFDGLGRG